jgi:hypothetical protein
MLSCVTVYTKLMCCKEKVTEDHSFSAQTVCPRVLWSAVLDVDMTQSAENDNNSITVIHGHVSCLLAGLFHVLVIPQTFIPSVKNVSNISHALRLYNTWRFLTVLRKCGLNFYCGLKNSVGNEANLLFVYLPIILLFLCVSKLNYDRCVGEMGGRMDYIPISILVFQIVSFHQNFVALFVFCFSMWK